MITKEKAYEIAIAYLGIQMAGRIEVTETLPELNAFVPQNRLKKAWIVMVPESLLVPLLDGPGPRFIAISKETDEIVFDGCAHQ